LSGTSSKPRTIEETILVPREISEWKSSEEHINRALAVQRENRQRFQTAFSQGLAVIGFRRDADGNGHFELGPFEDQIRGSRGL